MSIRNLDVLFNPQAIAVIGASEEKKAVGYYVLRNLIGKGFKGTVYPVNPLMERVQGLLSFKNINDIPYPVDLAIVASHAENFCDILDDCGQKKVKGVILLAPAFEYLSGDHKILSDQIKTFSSLYDYRILGPNSLGFLKPGLNLNVSLLPKLPQEGNVAFISQGGNFASAFLERAISKNVGFSYFVSLGDKMDINFSDIIDFLGIDPHTKAIVLHVREINNGRRFMAALRNFASSKPIVIVKSGRSDNASSVSLTHSGILATEDRIYEAAFKRVGAVQVNDMVDLLYMIETLAKQNRPKGRRLAVISNSISPADMAVNLLIKSGGALARPAGKTLESQKNNLPMERYMQNPIYLHSDASPADYMAALKNCLIYEDVDGVLLIYIPFPGIDPKDIAEAIVYAAMTIPDIPVFATLLGDETVLDAMKFLNSKNIPTYFTPGQAVNCFMYMYQYDNNLKLLRETPEIILKDFTPEVKKAEALIGDAVDRARESLHLDRATEVLKAYGIPVVKTLRASTEEDAVRESEKIGYPVVLKVDSETIPYELQKSGVRVNLKDGLAVRKAFVSLRNLASSFGDAAAEVIVQPMIIKQGCDLAIGAKKSSNFGTVIVFGMGGVFRGAIMDYSIGFPPLNQTLARHMMEETKIYRYLKGLRRFRDSLGNLEEMLVRFSHLIVDFPQIKEVDINPFLLTEKTGLVLDVSIYIDGTVRKWNKGDLYPPHLSIPPYPFKYVRETALKDGTSILIRPIRGEDEPAMGRFFELLSDKSVASRFGLRRINMPHKELVRFCQIDYDRDLAFIAVVKGNEEQIIGDVRINKLPDLESAELSFVVSDQWQGRGVGNVLMDYCIGVARGIGLKSLWMEIQKDNSRMIHVGWKYGFREIYDDEDIIKVVLQL